MSNVDALLVIFAREKHAGLFRQAASRLRQGLDPIEQYRIQEECGRLVIEADDLGYLPAIPELRKLIDWHTGDGVEDRIPGMQAVKVRCPGEPVPRRGRRPPRQGSARGRKNGPSSRIRAAAPLGMEVSSRATCRRSCECPTVNVKPRLANGSRS